MEFNTALLHKNFSGDKASGSTMTPIYQVSAFSHSSAEQLEKVFSNKAPGYAYSRIGNPTVASFEARIAALENGAGAVACSSGMAAVTMALLNILESGDEIIVGAGLFGGTIDLLKDLEAFGITAHFADKVTPQNVEPLINERTRAVFAELIGNPKLDIVDIEAVSNLAHRYNIPLIIDSTTATPYLVHPIDFGADIVVHSTSKYINGGGNAISGIIIDSGKFEWDTEKFKGMTEYKKYGKLSYLAKLRNGIWRNFGCCLAPFNAFLNSSLLYPRQHTAIPPPKSRYFLQFFETCKDIEVNYPALESSEYYALTQKLLKGKGGAILTIRAGSKEKAFELINNLKFATNATNIGDTRTLVIHPSSTIYAHSTEQQKENAGVFDDTIRISVGIEDIADLIEDFGNAISKINN